MSYNPEFTNLSSISALTGEAINDTSDPNTSQVLEWIEEVEKEMISKGFSTEALTGIIMDIPEGEVSRSDPVVSWIYDDVSFSSGKVVLLPHTPFISVANVQRNVVGYSQDPTWEDLTEGPGSSSHFLIIRSPYKAGLRGVALYFYNNIPSVGFQKLKLDYTWGYNLPETVLREYATCKASIMLLYSKYLRKEPIFDLNIAGLSSKLNPFTNVHVYILERLEAIKEQWLPSEYIGVAILP